MSKATYNRARVEILNYVINFTTIKSWMNGLTLQEENTWMGSAFNSGENIPIGSLVQLSSGPFTKWYLSWLIEYIPGKNGFDDVYVLQSIEDGCLCNWSNVSLFYLNPETLAKCPNWKWNDKQYQFRDWWNKALKRRGAYLLRSRPVVFDGLKVTIGLRNMWENDTVAEKTFEDYRKVKFKDLLKFYDQADALKQ